MSQEKKIPGRTASRRLPLIGAALACAVLTLPVPAGAQDEGGGPARGKDGKPLVGYARQQNAQSFATDKLKRSPRRSEWVSFQFHGKTLKGWAVYPQVTGRKVPVVLVMHEVFGLTDSTRNTADAIAAMGYIAITPDFLSGVGPNGGGTDSFLDESAGTKLGMREDAEVYPELEAWMDYANHLPQSTGTNAIVGLTWGGGVAFRYAVGQPRQDLKAVLIFCAAGPPVYNQGPIHNQKVINDWPVRKTNVPVYGFYGEYDITTVTPVLLSVADSERLMKAAGNFYEPVIYPRAEHAFLRVGEDPKDTNPGNAAADKAALARIKSVLAKTFR
ncbi:dienelactone hydrolase family protein [Novosphingobium flavum]|uniref:Dienelactone hydrolase family protein n=1 Tax=Novosphingobium flavum TaxID=1778672 RepID=A0A7X1KL85_9SPHN|nr:dienelactone hydrolase family protein [Novosphingobium flavum]MBC2665324.1 dienelactone hydrolase family protein [Novosphingobium flavum]